ncbi:MAG: class I SAM-dependent methyltransferase [Phycisphaerales bacterium]|jgi:glycine/sarcosine N-methyltransferase|nr:class I SAM-dependent methyltransferase [Phycisphaerales bacterium]MBT7172033.1 class I SAM-dependent methyltransferase [Phycisphaerales bacterium]
MTQKPLHSAEEFYDAIAGSYDGMFSFDARLERAGGFVEDLLLRFSVATALDIGCGTGSYALALARRGVRATGVDLSAVMLNKARKNGHELGLDVHFISGSMEHLPEDVGGGFDLLLCMGNTLPHLLSPESLNATLVGFREALAPGGRVVIHLLNYDAILAQQETHVGTSRDGDREYIRSYEFIPPLVRFNCLELDHGVSPPGRELNSTLLWPYTREELSVALGRAGFGEVRTFGGLDLENTDPATSDTLLLIASDG